MFAVQELASLFSDYFAMTCKGMNAQKWDMDPLCILRLEKSHSRLSKGTTVCVNEQVVLNLFVVYSPMLCYQL